MPTDRPTNEGVREAIEEIKRRAARAEKVSSGSNREWFVGNAYGLRESAVLLEALLSTLTEEEADHV